MNGPLATSLPAARVGHCMVNYGDKIFSTGDASLSWHNAITHQWCCHQSPRATKSCPPGAAFSNVWQFNPANNFAKADGAAMKKKRYGHGCGIVHSIHHGSRPLLVVAGSGWGATGAKNSEYWDFTVPGSTWQLCSKSCSFFSYYTSLFWKQYSNF